MPEHHSLLAGAELWHGRVADHVDVDFTGAFTDKQFFVPEWKDAPRDFTRTHDQWSVLPGFDEEYFEWLDVMAAVRSAEKRFVMMELGAGYGRWLVRAASAVRRYNPLPCLLVGIEGEPAHVEWMRAHFRNNGLDPDDHWIFHAAVGPSPGMTYFPAGDPLFWGQMMLGSGKPGPQRDRFLDSIVDGRFVSRIMPVPQITIADTAADLELIDLIDMDIQGAEAEVMEQAIDFCSERVRMIHIGTHSHALDDRLERIFSRAGWLPRYNFRHRSVCATPYGDIRFEDGVQSWVNPRFASSLERLGLLDPLVAWRIDLMPDMQAKEFVQIGVDGITVEPGDPQGHFLYGPYIRLPVGAYRAVLSVAARAPADPAGRCLSVDVTPVGKASLAETHCTFADLVTGRLELDFRVPEDCGVGETDRHPVEIRLSNPQNATVTVRSVALQKL